MSREPRRALITGASGGIGAACARRLAADGYRTALIARSRERLEQLDAELPGPRGTHLALEADVTDGAALARAFARIEAEFGGLELVVNNAGVGYRARVEDTTDDAIARVFETNVVGALRVARLALPLLRRGRRPVLINVSSVVARRGVPGQAVYSASKAALSSIGEALRLEWAQDRIEVCNLSPGLTSTGFFGAQENPDGLPRPDLARADTPEEVAAEVLALDRRPRPERSLRQKWRALAMLSLIAPRTADRLLARRLGGEWR